MEFLVGIDQNNCRYYQDYLPMIIRREFLADESVMFFGIDEDDTACGALALKLRVPEAELIWIYLAEDYRGRGIAQRILSDLMSRLRDQGFDRLVTGETQSGASTGAFRALLDSFPITYEETESAIAYSTPAQLQQVKDLSGAAKSSVAIAKVSGGALTSIEQAAVASGDDLVTFPIERSDYDEKLSCVYMKGGEPAGLLLAYRSAGKIATINYLYTVSPNPEAVLDMMRFFVAQAVSSGDLAFVRMILVNENLLGFLEKRAGVRVMRGFRATVDLAYIDRMRRKAQLRLSFWEEENAG